MRKCVLYHMYTINTRRLGGQLLKRGGKQVFKNIVISILASTALMQTGFFQPENMVQAVVLPVVWYVVFVISLTWIDCQRLAKKERRKGSD